MDVLCGPTMLCLRFRRILLPLVIEVSSGLESLKLPHF